MFRWRIKSLSCLHQLSQTGLDSSLLLLFLFCAQVVLILLFVANSNLIVGGIWKWIFFFSRSLTVAFPLWNTRKKHDFSFGVLWNLSECLGVGHTVFGNRGSGSCRRAAVCSSVWLLAFVPWNAVIVGALIRAVTAAPLSCAAVPLPLCGCALSVCFRLFQSSQLANPRRNCVKLLRWVKSASVEISRGLGGTFWAARLVKPLLFSSDCPAQPTRSTSAVRMCDQEHRTHLLFELHMLLISPIRRSTWMSFHTARWIRAQTVF